MPKKRAAQLTFDRIRQWVDNPDAPDLSTKDKEIYTRWDFAYDQLKTNKPAAVVSRLQKKFNISASQARLDIRHATQLLNPINRRESEWIRNYIVEDAIDNIEIARKKQDLKAWQKARQDLIKVYELDKDEQDSIDPEALGQNNYYITIIQNNGEAKKLNVDKLQELPEGKRVEYTNFLFEEIEDQEAEEIMNS